MQLGIDFGTTRTVVAYADRGNYPVVGFTDSHGDAHEFLPSLVASADQGLVYGFAAAQARAAGRPVLRSMKRELASAMGSTSSPVHDGYHQYPHLDVMAR